MTFAFAALTVDEPAGGFVYVVVALGKHGADIILTSASYFPDRVHDFLWGDIALPATLGGPCGRHRCFYAAFKGRKIRVLN